MGAQQSNGNSVLQSKNYTVIPQKDNLIYGSYKLIESQGIKYVMVSKTFQNDNEYNELLNLLNQSKKLNQIQEYVKLIEINAQEESNLCSSFYKVSALYEYFETTLRSALQQNSLSCLYILKCLTDVLQKLLENNVIHGNITPDYILFDLQSNQIKLNNCTQLTGYNHYKRALLTEGQWYFSPELVYAFSQKEFNPQYNNEKHEVYIMALIALEFWASKDIQQIYNKQECKINKDILESYLDEFGIKNGYVLKNVLRQMLQIDPNQRPTFKELQESFTDLYQEYLNQQIKNKEQIIDISNKINDIKEEDDLVVSAQFNKESIYQSESVHDIIRECNKNIEEVQKENIESPKIKKQLFGKMSGKKNQFSDSKQQSSSKKNLISCSMNLNFDEIKLSTQILQEKEVNNLQSPKSKNSIKSKQSVRLNSNIYNLSNQKQQSGLKKPKNEGNEFKPLKYTVLAAKRK